MATWTDSLDAMAQVLGDAENHGYTVRRRRGGFLLENLDKVVFVYTLDGSFTSAVVLTANPETPTNIKTYQDLISVLGLS